MTNLLSPVGWVNLVRGTADLQGGGPIFVLYGDPYTRYKSRGAAL